MPALIESDAGPIAPFDLAAISQQLADDVSRLVPYCGGYTVEDYLTLNGNYLVEYVDGCLQVLPMPDSFHQAIIRTLCTIFENWLASHDPDGRLVDAPFKVYLNDRVYREPDAAVMVGAHKDRRTSKFWRGADLVIEVISETNRRHDVVTKMAEYAIAEISEYWIIDPEQKTLSVFVLNAGQYQPKESTKTAVCHVVPGLTVDVANLFAEAAKRA